MKTSCLGKDEWQAFSPPIAVFLLIGLLAGISHIRAEPLTLVRTFVDPTPAANDVFGYSLAIAGDLLAVGAPFDDASGTDSGSVFVFDLADGSLLHALANPSGLSDEFGSAVAMSGGRVVVGAFRADLGGIDSGVAYVFDAVSGDLIGAFHNPQPATGDFFGRAVALEGDVVVVGAPNKGNDNTGAAYVFDAASGDLLHVLTAPTPVLSGRFGNLVAVSGERLFVGSLLPRQVHQFDALSGSLERTYSGGGQNQNSLSALGDFLLVGRPDDDIDGDFNRGRAHLIDVATGVVVASLENPTTGSDLFGEAVGLGEDFAIVGAPRDDSGAVDSGLAFFFDVDSGLDLQTLANPQPGARDRFGSRVAIAGDKVVVANRPRDVSLPIGLGNSEVRLYTVAAGSTTLYAADDRADRDTQLFSADLESGAQNDLGGLLPLADFETLAFETAEDTLYGITAESGALWRIDTSSGAVSNLCTIPTVRKFREIASSSFHPETGELWAYQWNQGLVTINLETCERTLEWFDAHQQGVPRKWDGLAWAPDASVLYASQRRDLYMWEPFLRQKTIVCSNLPDKTEGLEHAPDGRLLGTSGSKLYEIDPETCTVVEVFDFVGREDIESLTFE